MCVKAVVGDAPCQCFSPAGNHTTSPGWIPSIGPPHRCTRPNPAVTTSVCPSGCVCHAVRARGSNVTYAPDVRDGSFASNNGSIRTEPVKFCAGPLRDGCDPLRAIAIGCELAWWRGATFVIPAAAETDNSISSDGTVVACQLIRHLVPCDAQRRC